MLERSLDVVVSTRKHVAWKFSTQELTLSVEKYSERYIKPAMVALANKIDADGCALYKDVYNCVGTPASTPDSFADVALASRRLDDEAVPNDARKMVVNPAAGWAIAGAMAGLYNPKLVEEAIRRGAIGHFAGFDTFTDQNVKTHTVGAHGGTPLVNGTISEGASTIPSDGWTASTAVLKQGDVITIAAVYAVNPVSGDSTGVLRQFVVIADVTSDGSGEADIPVAPVIYSAAAGETYLPYQTVDALPADNAAITVLGTASTGYPQNIGFHKNAFALVTVPLEMPDSAGWKARESYDGLSIRAIKFYDGTNDEETIRLDILYGWKTVYPDLACRLIG